MINVYGWMMCELTHNWYQLEKTWVRYYWKEQTINKVRVQAFGGGKNVLKHFIGEGDVVALIKKIELVAKLQKKDYLAKCLSLYLEMDLDLDESSQADVEVIKTKLWEAFSDRPFSAFAKLSSIKWTGQKVDVFANEIRQLVGFLITSV